MNKTKILKIILIVILFLLSIYWLTRTISAIYTYNFGDFGPEPLGQFGGRILSAFIAFGNLIGAISSGIMAVELLAFLTKHSNTRNTYGITTFVFSAIGHLLFLLSHISYQSFWRFVALPMTTGNFGKTIVFFVLILALLGSIVCTITGTILLIVQICKTLLNKSR